MIPNTREDTAPDGATGVARAAEVATKLAAVRAWLSGTGHPAVVLTRRGPLAWIGAGLTDPVERDTAVAPVWALVSATEAALLTTDVEAPRLRTEESVEALGFDLYAAPWHEPERIVTLVEEVAGVPRTAIAADGHPAFGIDADVALAGMRVTLTAAEVERLRCLARDAATALEGALGGWRPGERDVVLQARIAAALEAEGILAACLIVGGDERVVRFRHPVAVGARIERLAMAVVVGQRRGLHVALTRFAVAGRASSALRAAHERVRDLETYVLEAVRPGATYGQVVEALASGYAAVGRPEEWREHYQGGPVGYRQREFEIAPGQVASPWWSRRVAGSDAVAYNPSLAGGAKIEDTFLVTAEGPELLTTGGGWPMTAVALKNGKTVSRPVILEL